MCCRWVCWRFTMKQWWICWLKRPRWLTWSWWVTRSIYLASQRMRLKTSKTSRHPWRWGTRTDQLPQLKWTAQGLSALLQCVFRGYFKQNCEWNSLKQEIRKWSWCSHWYYEFIKMTYWTNCWWLNPVELVLISPILT